MNKSKNSTNNNKTSDLQSEVKELVLARVKAASDNLSIAIGSTEYTKEDMLKNIEEDNSIGREIIEIQMEYLRDMAEGAVYQATNG